MGPDISVLGILVLSWPFAKAYFVSTDAYARTMSQGRQSDSFSTTKRKVVELKGGKIPCTFLRFFIDADLLVIRSILQPDGLGSKNRLGFGYTEVIDG